MIGLDTNILVRYLTKDDDQQWYQAIKIVEGGEQCFITNVVICELIWVLRSKTYNFSKEEISNIVEIMLQCAVFEWENRSVIYQALQRFKHGNADFSDYLIGAVAQQFGCTITATFDRKLKNEKGFDCV
ncbi:MAG: PIN domain-containing protein [Dolichospermum sp.]